MRERRIFFKCSAFPAPAGICVQVEHLPQNLDRGQRRVMTRKTT
jgi:hypothetical protein